MSIKEKPGGQQLFIGCDKDKYRDNVYHLTYLHHNQERAITIANALGVALRHKLGPVVWNGFTTTYRMSQEAGYKYNQRAKKFDTMEERAVRATWKYHMMQGHQIKDDQTQGCIVADAVLEVKELDIFTNTTLMKHQQGGSIGTASDFHHDIDMKTYRDSLQGTYDIEEETQGDIEAEDTDEENMDEDVTDDRGQDAGKAVVDLTNTTIQITDQQIPECTLEEPTQFIHEGVTNSTTNDERRDPMEKATHGTIIQGISDASAHTIHSRLIDETGNVLAAITKVHDKAQATQAPPKSHRTDSDLDMFDDNEMEVDRIQHITHEQIKQTHHLQDMQQVTEYWRMTTVHDNSPQKQEIQQEVTDWFQNPERNKDDSEDPSMITWLTNAIMEFHQTPAAVQTEVLDLLKSAKTEFETKYWLTVRAMTTSIYDKHFPQDINYNDDWHASMPIPDMQGHEDLDEIKKELESTWIWTNENIIGEAQLPAFILEFSWQTAIPLKTIIAWIKNNDSLDPPVQVMAIRYWQNWLYYNQFNKDELQELEQMYHPYPIILDPQEEVQKLLNIQNISDKSAYTPHDDNEDNEENDDTSQLTEHSY